MTKPTTYIQARNRDFLSQCLDVARAMPRLSLSEVVQIALTRRPQCFYIDYERASRLVSRVLRHNEELQIAKTATREMTQDLLDRVHTVAEARNIPLREALTYVLNHAQPKRFYISYRHALRIAHKKLKNVAVAK